MILMGVLAAYVPWGSSGLQTFVASCAWFASPTLAAGIVFLMVELGWAGIEVEYFLCSQV